MANISFWFFKPKLPKDFDRYSERLQFRTLSDIASILEARSNVCNILKHVNELLWEDYTIEELEKKHISGKDRTDYLELYDLKFDSWCPVSPWDSPKRLLKKIIQKVYKIATKKYTGKFESDFVCHRFDCWDKWKKWCTGEPVCFGLFMAKKND